MLSMIYLIFSRVGEVDPLWEKLAGKMRFVPRKCVKWVTIALKFSLQILLFYAMKYFVKPETDNYFKILRKGQYTWLTQGLLSIWYVLKDQPLNKLEIQILSAHIDFLNCHEQMDDDYFDLLN